MIRPVPKTFSTFWVRSFPALIGAMCLVAVVCLTWDHGLASASTARLATQSTSVYPAGCKTVSFTGDGGYWDNANFNWQPEDTVTVTTHWCYAGGVITSHTVSYTTTIPSSLDPRLTLGSKLYKLGRVLEVAIGGDYTAGIFNNVGQIYIVGYVNSLGHHHFVNEPNAGG
jgi:hypothetical protein